MIYVLDASTVLRFTDQEPGFDRVRTLFYQAAEGEIRLLLSAINWGEIVSVLYAKNETDADRIIGNLAALPIVVVPVDARGAAEAGRFKWIFKLALADSFAGALTLSCGTGSGTEQATLVTADYDFKSIPKTTMRIEFLPAK